MNYLIRNAVSSDLAAIMAIEKESFAAPIMESETVFLDRLNTASPYTFLLCPLNNRRDESPYIQTGTDSAQPFPAGGYFSSERWKESTFSVDDFALGHSAAERHCAAGSVLYISSFALAPALRGVKLTDADRYAVFATTHCTQPTAKNAALFQKSALKQPTGESLARFFFRTALSTITAAHPTITRIVLIVHEKWTKAIGIYESQGFHRTGVFERFTGFAGSSAFLYEKSLTQDTHHAV